MKIYIVTKAKDDFNKLKPTMVKADLYEKPKDYESNGVEVRYFTDKKQAKKFLNER